MFNKEVTFIQILLLVNLEIHRKSFYRILHNFSKTENNFAIRG